MFGPLSTVEILGVASSGAVSDVSSGLSSRKSGDTDTVGDIANDDGSVLSTGDEVNEKDGDAVSLPTTSAEGKRVPQIDALGTTKAL